MREARALTLFLGLSALMLVRAARQKMPPPRVAQPAATSSTKDGKSLAAPWMKPLKAALQHGGSQRQKRDRSEAKRKQVQLATVDPVSLRPAVRTIVFRGFMPRHLMLGCSQQQGGKLDDEESCALMFITDSRAEKVRHLQHPQSSTYVECCWWLDEAGVQFRISGRAVLATATSEDPALRAACETVWTRLQSSTKGTFFWPAPGEPISTHPAAALTTDELSLDEANFALVVVLPERVDELRLGGKQRRVLYTLEQPQISTGMMEGGDLLAQHAKTQWRQEGLNP